MCRPQPSDCTCGDPVQLCFEVYGQSGNQSKWVAACVCVHIPSVNPYIACVSLDYIMLYFKFLKPASRHWIRRDGEVRIQCALKLANVDVGC